MILFLNSFNATKDHDDDDWRFRREKKGKKELNDGEDCKDFVASEEGTVGTHRQIR